MFKPEEAWDIIKRNAEKAFKANTVWCSPIKIAPYKLLQVTNSSLSIQRLNGGKTEKLTKDKVIEAAEKLLAAEGSIKRGTLISPTVAKETAFVFFHSELGWSSDLSSIIWNSNFGKSFTAPEVIDLLAKEMINEAVKIFGPISESEWAFRRVSIVEESNPHLYYPPENMYYPFPSPKHVDINLTKSVNNNFEELIFQLAHEVLHLICPTGDPYTSNLEEGLACYFSKMMLIKYVGNDEYFEKSLTKTSPYYKPYLATSRILEHDKLSIKNLREVQPILKDITVDDLVKVGIEGTQEELAFLTSPMDYSPVKASDK